MESEARPLHERYPAHAPATPFRRERYGITLIQLNPGVSRKNILYLSRGTSRRRRARSKSSRAGLRDHDFAPAPGFRATRSTRSGRGPRFWRKFRVTAQAA